MCVLSRELSLWPTYRTLMCFLTRQSRRALRRFKQLARYSPSTWLQKQSVCVCSCSQPAVSTGRIHSLHTCSKQQGCRLTRRPADWWARWKVKTQIERECVRKRRRESTTTRISLVVSFLCLFEVFLQNRRINLIMKIVPEVQLCKFSYYIRSHKHTLNNVTIFTLWKS